eukprot:CAMPEP_0203765616 /NCGR_PEP_ID=MMETSP0098-20131031/18510_1 /ASSEMBLY_ACC=CAM_ASM_000208 /TAXON_ID=96639 /ORGANISM=" , Strain NY0313808BC1" /LENGTH=660 /DNA_ID=CAMNT_0050661883 /DNA_START=154 /DNA_END=2134 /DNA_ORIENTATION=+
MSRESERSSVEWDPLSAGHVEQDDSGHKFNPFSSDGNNVEAQVMDMSGESEDTVTDRMVKLMASSPPKETPPNGEAYGKFATEGDPPPPEGASTTPEGAAAPPKAADVEQVGVVAAVNGEAVKEQADPEQVTCKVANVTYMSPTHDVLLGTLVVTNYRLRFLVDGDKEKHGWLYFDEGIFDVPLGVIEKVSRVSKGQMGNAGLQSLVIYIHCKDFRRIQLRFVTVADASKVYNLVRMSAFPVSDGQGMKWLFAFEYGRVKVKSRDGIGGWAAYNAMDEWVRQGIFVNKDASSRNWRVSQINNRYDFCPSYPALLVVPINTSDEDLRAVGSFRSKNRIPAFTYYHAVNGGCIWRCSQPKVGLGNVCRADEQMWSNIRVLSGSDHARIVDCRPYKSAIANKAKGMGYEDEARYTNTSISFQNIQNIHVARTSMEKLESVISSPPSGSNTSGSSSAWSNWLACVEGTGWLNHIRVTLNASITTARFVATNAFSVLVHCSDGWDRTSQVCALAQILLDPFFRTIHGFKVLVEKDWLSFGYKMSERTGHGAEGGSDERSPCFLQFIDCIWQLLNQFPTMFEYNEEFLMCILESLYSCKFGTFFCDNERERVQHALKDRTISLWDHIDQNVDTFKNIYYSVTQEEIKKKTPLLPHPSVVCRQVTLW